MNVSSTESSPGVATARRQPRSEWKVNNQLALTYYFLAASRTLAGSLEAVEYRYPNAKPIDGTAKTDLTTSTTASGATKKE